MIRALAQRLRTLFQPSLPRLERHAEKRNLSLQARMDIDERNQWFPPEFRQRYGGFHPPAESRNYLPSFPLDRVRSDMIALLLREIVVAQIPGSFAELGVHHGWSARLIHHYCPERRFHLLDTFTGFTDADLKKESVRVSFNTQPAFNDTTVDLVRTNIAPVGSMLKFVPGWFPASATPELRADRFAFVHLDADLEAPTTAGLEFFRPRMSPG